MRFPLLLFLKWARRIINLLPLPKWTDVEATRVWVGRTLELADEIADETKTQVDDKIVDALSRIVSDTEIWTAFYALIVDLISEGETSSTAEADTRVTDLANKAGIDFGIFQKLLDMILEFIVWWRNRV
ncbi:hypothetical protein LCGC14_1535910 [marine sediment metagenome]|uniref:Uncharacterized protein n=1 Tax=marine sediment metagenome TaxID=412755 RepID=A0A0F9LA83_9ZZZZ